MIISKETLERVARGGIEDGQTPEQVFRFLWDYTDWMDLSVAAPWIDCSLEQLGEWFDDIVQEYKAAYGYEFHGGHMLGDKATNCYLTHGRFPHWATDPEYAGIVVRETTPDERRTVQHAIDAFAKRRLH